LDEGWEIDRIATVLGAHSKSIQRWEDNYRNHGCVNPPAPLRGRPRLLSSDITAELHELLTESPSLLLDEIGEWLAIYHDQPISTTALHDNLKDLGLTYKCLKRIATQRDDAYRADWLHNMTSNYTADQLVFLDESSKDDHAILCRYSRAISGQTARENVSLNKGVRYSVLPVLTIDGYIAVRAVEGSIDGAEFFNFVLNDVVSLQSHLHLVSVCEF
jgi:transposase